MVGVDRRGEAAGRHRDRRRGERGNQLGARPGGGHQLAAGTQDRHVALVLDDRLAAQHAGQLGRRQVHADHAAAGRLAMVIPGSPVRAKL